MARNQSSDRRPTKAERKEQARIEREEIQRRRASRSRNRTLLIVVGVVLVGLVIGGAVWAGGDEGPVTPPAVVLPDPSTLAGVMQSPPPWSDNIQDTNARLGELGLPGLSETILHHHFGLWIYVDGNPAEVPAGIGYNQQLGVFSPLHTHDALGTIHVESADPNFQPVLGQFMDVWGLYFTPTCIGSLCNEGDKRLRVYVNGQEYTGDPTMLPVTDMLAVVVTYGTQEQLPDPIPDTFTLGA